MRGVPLHIDLPKYGSPACELGGSPGQPARRVIGLAIEGEFCSGSQTDGYGRFVDTCEPARKCIRENRGDQLISNFRWPRCDVMQAVVTHAITPIFDGRSTLRHGASSKRTEIAAGRASPSFACRKSRSGKPLPTRAFGQQKTHLSVGS
jgi:hypothetical protein